MMYVTFHVTGRVTVPVDDSGENAKLGIHELISQAKEKVSEMDFGPLRDIDWEEHHVDDENGNRVYQVD